MRNPKIEWQCPEKCYCFEPSCGGHELCMEGLNCPTYCGPTGFCVTHQTCWDVCPEDRFCPGKCYEVCLPYR